jgi:hypothetical protein
MGHGPTSAADRRQPRLRSIQGLDSALFVCAQHRLSGVDQRGQVRPEIGTAPCSMGA